LLFKELSLLQKINCLLFYGASSNVILQEIATGLRERFGYVVSVVHLYDEEKRCLVNLSYCADSKLVKEIEKLTGLKVKDYQIPVARGSMFYKALTERKPVITQDIKRLVEEHTDDPRLKRLAPVITKISGIKYGVGVPLIAKDRVLGIIGIGSKKKIREEDVRRLASFGAQAGLAVEKAERDEKLRKYSRKLEALIEERTKALRDEKNRAEFYVDLMSHDIQNFNTVALGHLELVLEDPELDDDTKELVSTALSAIKRSSNLIDNVRKLQRGGGAFGKKSVSKTLWRIINQIKNLYSNKDIHVNYDGREALVYADELLEDVFFNLLDNAVKHCPSDDVVIDIDVEDNSENVRISITDRGKGVPDEMKERIFTRYEKLNEGVQGSGLGLHLVKTLVDKYGGKVWVEDRVKGDHTKGSTFYVTLPKRF
jgi:signal transduction histidine kinase